MNFYALRINLDRHYSTFSLAASPAELWNLNSSIFRISSRELAGKVQEFDHVRGKGGNADFERGLDFCCFVREAVFRILDERDCGATEWISHMGKEGEGYGFLRIAKLVDCLDVNESVIETLSGSNEIAYIEKVSIISDKVPTGTLLFQMPQFRKVTIVTDRFIELAIEEKWSGLRISALDSPTGFGRDVFVS